MNSLISRVASQTGRRTFSTKAAERFNHYPKNVGILALDTYFPRTFVRQSDLEVFDKVGKGKYTVGLEQETMAVSGDREDIYSMCLTVTQRLLEQNGLSPKDIGRLEVGTETVLDKSKSIKTVLMPLFEKSGNTNIEGIDTINACYGGTAALLNALSWIESSAWDGRYALVVCGDIAVYAPGPARPTGGAGVVAMLIGPQAPLVVERGLRGSYFEHAYDFYKPNLESEYPAVDGHLSITCYYRALDHCYRIYNEQFQKYVGQTFTLGKGDYALFHSPFWKLVRKSYARMLYLEYLKNPSDPQFASVPQQLAKLTAEQSYTDKDVTKVFNDLSTKDFANRVEPGSLLPKHLGNSYTGSLYTGLLSLLTQVPSNTLQGKRVMMFSYGSGLAATLFSLNVAGSTAEIASRANVQQRLSQRVALSAEDYTQLMKRREQVHNLNNFTPTDSVDQLFPGTYYLEHVDGEKRRTYARKN